MTLLKVRHLAVGYGRKRILERVDFDLEAAEVVGLIGANGSGKTTFLRALLGLLRCEPGQIEWQRSGGPNPPEGVDHFGGAHALPPHVSARKWMRLLSRGEVDGDDRRPFRTLSRGTRQLLGLRTVLGRSGLTAVFLDEPWEGLDPDGARWLTETLHRKRAAGCGLLVSSHRLHDLAGVCDRYAFLQDGRLIVRSASELASGPVRGADLLRAFDRVLP